MARLADTLNRMLASLEAAREREQRFVADAAHELRTPITALLGNAAFITRYGADEAALADIEADANRLSRTLEDLIALAREDGAGPPGGAVSLDEVARRAAPDEVAVIAPRPVRPDPPRRPRWWSRARGPRRRAGCGRAGGGAGVGAVAGGLIGGLTDLQTLPECEERVAQLAKEQRVDIARLRRTWPEGELERMLSSQLIDEKVLDFLASTAKVDDSSAS